MSAVFWPDYILEDNIALPGIDIKALGLTWSANTRPVTFPTFAEHVEPEKMITDEGLTILDLYRGLSFQLTAKPHETQLANTAD